MVTLEYLANFSNATDLILYAVSGLTIFYGLKVKFVKQAEKAAQGVEKRVFDKDDKDSVVNKVSHITKCYYDLEKEINNIKIDVGTMKGKLGI
jgi:hypothetical protein